MTPPHDTNDAQHGKNCDRKNYNDEDEQNDGGLVDGRGLGGEIIRRRRRGQRCTSTSTIGLVVGHAVALAVDGPARLGLPADGPVEEERFVEGAEAAGGVVQALQRVVEDVAADGVVGVMGGGSGGP